jgi:hypothetical protein
MAKPRAVFEYDYETINKLSDWPEGRLYKDQTVGDVDMSSFASVCLWLASNGTDWFRAAMFSRLVGDAFGTHGRPEEINEAIMAQSSPELLKLVFRASSKNRKATAKRRGTRVKS